MRQLQVTNEKGEKNIFETVDEILTIVKDIIPSMTVMDAFIGGVPIHKNGSTYELLGNPIDN